jgi:hypothetical protein
MEWAWGRGAMRGAVQFIARPNVLAAAACALALSACNQSSDANLSAAQPRGATVAFESIDGPPAGQFHTLVQDLNDEAQARRLAVISRESPSAYRVRGYLAASVEEDHTTISWVWDVFDRDQRRAFRITGAETANDRHGEAWTAADDAMLHRIARSSMDQLAAFLTSPEVAPGTPAPDSTPELALAGPREFTPEAAGIFRISHADPVSGETAVPPRAATDDVPLPPRRPAPAEAVSAPETLTLSAMSH